MNVGRTVLWWGRFDPDYSRNRILRQIYTALGWKIVDFHPWVSAFGDVEAKLRGLSRVDLLHVPCFRQRDMGAASRYARRHGIPLLFDPLISAFDKQVHERRKLMRRGPFAWILLRHEQRLFGAADLVLADTPEHARFFADVLAVRPERLQIVYVGAEEPLFAPAAVRHAPNRPLEVLFYGSFIPLQGPEVIVAAARRYVGPPVRWTLLGAGPLKRKCQHMARGLPNVTFEEWVPYPTLPERIRRADILLGVFGSTPKAGRVLPNKVFQAMACGRPVVTRTASAYPESLRNVTGQGLVFVADGNPQALAETIGALARQPDQLQSLGTAARTTYDNNFAPVVIRQQFTAALTKLAPELSSKTQRPLNILNVYFGRTRGGIEQAFVDYTIALMEQGHHVTCVVHPECLDIDQLKEAGADIRLLHNRGHYDFWSAYRLRQLAARLQPDLALGHNGRGYEILKRALRGRLPLVAVKHNDNTKRLRGMDFVICVNSTFRQQLLSLGHAPKTVAVIPNMIDLSTNQTPKTHPFHTPVVIGALGRFCRQKGFDVLLHALRYLRDMHPDLLWRAVLGGSGELDCELRGLASELGLSKRIHFAGWVADKADFFSSIDLFVLPSRDEPFGIVVIEAARYGIPIVATRCHGPLDIIDDGQDGLLVDIEDPKELAQQLYCLIMDPVSAQALAHNAYAKMAQRYSRQVVGRQLSSTLKELVAGWNQ